jgi:hypothetical protein
LAYPRRTVGGNAPARRKEENAMTDFNHEDCELTAEELEVVSGGRVKIEKPDFVKAIEIAKIQQDNPGF